jgi:hypothetical protein
LPICNRNKSLVQEKRGIVTASRALSEKKDLPPHREVPGLFPVSSQLRYPQTKVQLCIVHLVRASLKYVTDKGSGPLRGMMVY